MCVYLSTQSGRQSDIQPIATRIANRQSIRPRQPPRPPPSHEHPRTCCIKGVCQCWHHSRPSATVTPVLYAHDCFGLRARNGTACSHCSTQAAGSQLARHPGAAAPGDWGDADGAQGMATTYSGYGYYNLLMLLGAVGKRLAGVVGSVGWRTARQPCCLPLLRAEWRRSRHACNKRCRTRRQHLPMPA